MPRSKPLLFEYYPDLESKISWKQIGDFPTPVTELTNLEIEIGHQSLWMKRDDLSQSRYGGNKVRKLEFILGDVEKRGSKWILTFGGLGSNHALATTIYAKDIDVKVILALVDQPVTAHVQENLLLDQHFGAKLSYAKNIVGAFFKGIWYLISKRNVYFLWIGGSTEMGSLGYVDAGLELAQQIDQGELPKPSRIYVPVGTMGTLSGLHLGCRFAGLDVELVGVRVNDRFLADEKKTAKMINNTARTLRSVSDQVPMISVSREDIKMRHEFAGPCYGSVTDEGREAVRLMKEYEDIQLETTYTGKTLACMLDDTKNEGQDADSLLFWNTYNSVDLSHIVRELGEPTVLPKPFHKFYSEIFSPNIADY